MRTVPPRVSIALVLGIVLLLILAFPGSLYASDLSISQESRVPAHCPQLLAVSVTHRLWVRNRERREARVLLMDAMFACEQPPRCSAIQQVKNLLSTQALRFE